MRLFRRRPPVVGFVLLDGVPLCEVHVGRAFYLSGVEGYAHARTDDPAQQVDGRLPMLPASVLAFVVPAPGPKPPRRRRP